MTRPILAALLIVGTPRGGAMNDKRIAPGSARLSTLKSGDRVLADGGFTCMRPGLKKVQADSTGHLWVRCNDGRHYLVGQLYGPTDVLMGLFRLSADAP